MLDAVRQRHKEVFGAVARRASKRSDNQTLDMPNPQHSFGILPPLSRGFFLMHAFTSARFIHAPRSAVLCPICLVCVV